MADRSLVDKFVDGYDNPRTRASYRQTLSLWFRWCDTAGVDPLDATRHTIEAWARAIEAQGRQKTTVAARLHGLGAFYNWCVVEDHLAVNPMTHVRRPKVDSVGRGHALKRQELANLMAAAEAEGPTSLAVLCLLAYNGLRISEAVGVDIADIGTERFHSTLLVHRKGPVRPEP